jgi:hypothetical protein
VITSVRVVSPLRESRPRLREPGELGDFGVVISGEDVMFAADLRARASLAAERMAVEVDAAERAPARSSAEAVQAMAARAVPPGPEAGQLHIPLSFVDRMVQLDARDLEVATDAADRWTASVLLKINADQVPGYREVAVLDSPSLRAAIEEHERGIPLDSSDRYLARRNLGRRLEEAQRAPAGDSSAAGRAIALRAAAARRAGTELPFDLVRGLAWADAQDMAKISGRRDREVATHAVVDNLQGIPGYWSFLRRSAEFEKVFGVALERLSDEVWPRAPPGPER